MITESKTLEAEKNFRNILQIFNQDVESEGMKDTPKRFIKFLNEFLSKEPLKISTFDSEGYDSLIEVSGIDLFSLCEHHTLPFFGTCKISYIPEKRIAGLSKFARITNHFANNFQNQERITKQIAEFIFKEIKPKYVKVEITAKHLCMCMRGVKNKDAETKTIYELKKQQDGI